MSEEGDFTHKRGSPSKRRHRWGEAATSPGKLEGARSRVPPGASRRNQPCQHLDFSPLRPSSASEPRAAVGTTKFRVLCYSSCGSSRLDPAGPGPALQLPIQPLTQEGVLQTRPAHAGQACPQEPSADPYSGQRAENAMEPEMQPDRPLSMRTRCPRVGGRARGRGACKCVPLGGVACCET